MNQSTPIRAHSSLQKSKTLYQSLPIQPEDCSSASQIDKAMNKPKTFKKMLETNPFFKAQVEAQIKEHKERQKDMICKLYANSLEEDENAVLTENSLASYILKRESDLKKRDKKLKRLLVNK